jgi:2-keto-4-pentenoate hydratase
MPTPPPDPTLSEPAALAADAVQNAARFLAVRRLRGRQGPVLPAACRPRTLADALAIQQAVVPLMGWPVGGWKCALPSEGKLVVAPIYAPTIQTGDTAQVWARDGQVRIEPELAFVLGLDLPAREQPYTDKDVDSAIVHTHLALELIDSRYDAGAELTFEDKLADGLVNQGLFLGPELPAAASRNAAAFEVRLQVGNAPLQVLAGVHPDGLPRKGLYWLVEFLRARGQGLKAGQVVITGSYAGAPTVPVGEPMNIRYEGLGHVTLTLSARSS